MTIKILRLLDASIAFTGLIIFLPIMVFIYIVGIFDTGSPIFFQKRIGKNKCTFMIVKFRSMRVDALSIDSHLIDTKFITNFGHFLRKYKLDELPQLWNVLKGEMSIVGPRPCLPIQKKLIIEREKRGVFRVLPGITGLAQINSIDMSDPILLSKTDSLMIENFNINNYFKYILLTILGKGQGDRTQS